MYVRLNILKYLCVYQTLITQLYAYIFSCAHTGEEEGDEPVILTDILGLEDALGTMDFKGTHPYIVLPCLALPYSTLPPRVKLTKYYIYAFVIFRYVDLSYSVLSCLVLCHIGLH